jgi:hypothetical protein
LLNFIPVTVPAASLALKVRVTAVEEVDAAAELIETLPVGGVVSAGATSWIVSVADDVIQFPELSLNRTYTVLVPKPLESAHE